MDIPIRKSQYIHLWVWWKHLKLSAKNAGWKQWELLKTIILAVDYRLPSERREYKTTKPGKGEVRKPYKYLTNPMEAKSKAEAEQVKKVI